MFTATLSTTVLNINNILSLILIITLPTIISSAKTKTTERYLLKHERAELHTINEDFMGANATFTLRKINRTALALNTTYTMLQEMPDKKLLKLTVAKKYGETYRRMSAEIVVDLCEFFQRDMFGIPADMAKHGNIDGCPVLKKTYYLLNYMPDYAKFPKLLPYASYRLTIELIYQEKQVFIIYWFASVEKVITW